MTEVKAFDWDELEFCSPEERVAKLKQHVKEIAGTEDVGFENPGAPPEILEQFWRRVVEYEENLLGISPAPCLPPLDFPDASKLNDEELHTLLWEKIAELSERRIFLSQTDHLSDRELYEVLCSAEMREATTESVPENGAVHFDILGACSQEDLQLYLKYYADESTREEWREDWPDDPFPEKATPLFDRDAKLPRPWFEERLPEE